MVHCFYRPWWQSCEEHNLFLLHLLQKKIQLQDECRNAFKLLLDKQLLSLKLNIQVCQVFSDVASISVRKALNCLWFSPQDLMKLTVETSCLNAKSVARSFHAASGCAKANNNYRLEAIHVDFRYLESLSKTVGKLWQHTIIFNNCYRLWQKRA